MAGRTVPFIMIMFLSIGSMSGNRMDNANEALFLFLKSLPTDCYFNIVSFGSNYSSLFKYVLPNVYFV